MQMDATDEALQNVLMKESSQVEFNLEAVFHYSSTPQSHMHFIF